MHVITGMAYMDETQFNQAIEQARYNRQVQETTQVVRLQNNTCFSSILDSCTQSTASNTTSTTGVNVLDEYFNNAASTYQVPVNLLKAVARQESNFQADIVSTSGAQGIMQLMPSTAKYLGVSNPMDPEQNIMGGAKLLSQLLAKYNNNLSLALAAYNAGSGAVDKYEGIPPYTETQNYVNKILSSLT